MSLKNILTYHQRNVFKRDCKFTLRVELKANGVLEVNLALVLRDQSTMHFSVLFWETGVTAVKSESAGGS